MIHIHKNIFVPFLRHVIFLFSLARFDVTHSPANKNAFQRSFFFSSFLMYVTPYEVCCECTHPTCFVFIFSFTLASENEKEYFVNGEKELIWLCTRKNFDHVEWRPILVGVQKENKRKKKKENFLFQRKINEISDTSLENEREKNKTRKK